MHLETLTFDRVFDLHRRESSRYAPKRTDFSFEASGKRRFAVQAMGWPEVTPGDTITAALGSAGNWQTLIGWKNHTTGQLVLPDADRALNGMGLAVGMALIGYFYGSIALTPTSRQWPLALMAFGGVMALHGLVKWQRTKTQARIIRDLPPPAI